MFRKTAGVTLIAGVLVMAGFGVGGQKGATAKKDAAAEGPFTGDPKTVVAKVAGKEIRLEEVTKIVEMWKSSQMQIPGASTEREIQRKALDNIIDRQLLHAAAVKAGLVPDSTQIEQQFEMFRQRFGDPARFQQWLGTQGMSEQQAKTEIATDLAVQKYITAQVPDTAHVTPEDARVFYDTHQDVFTQGEKVHARHILVKVDPSATQEQKDAAHRKAERLLSRVRSGEEFAKVARDSSDCPSAPKGGDLPEFSRGEMVAPFEEAAFALQAGQMSDIVESQFGYHIIKVEGRTPPKTVPYDQNVEGYAMRQVQSERRNELFKKMIESLESGAKITRKI